MDIQSMEEEARLAALRQVSLMLQRPDQLEKLDSYKKRTARKKAAVEAMLKTAVQSQLEGVRSGINQLQTAAEDVKTAKDNLQEIQELLSTIVPIKDRLSKLKEESMKHSQYAAAMENLKHIFNVPETIEKTHELIQDGKLLAAHKNLMELETARDDLMFQVHRLQSQSDYDKNMLKSYFSEVEKLAQELSKQIWYILGRTLEAVRGTDPGPQQVVTCLRIIEREERIDKYCVEQEKSTGFLPVGRPRRWREKCFEILENVVRQRIEGNQLEDRTINKQWLARYLEVCRRIVVDDLRVAKSGCLPCFPSDFEIYERYVLMYHKCLAERLREIASDELEKHELVQLLSWVQQYGSEQMLGHPALQIDASNLIQDIPLLPKTTISQLSDKFLEVTRTDITEWLDKSLQQEKDDWYKGAAPEEDSIGQLYTALPAILFGMVEDQIRLTKEISNELVPSVLFLNVEELLNFAGRYKDACLAFKNKHFEDRSRFQLFTQVMIAIANNCEICIESTDQIKKQARLTLEADPQSPRASVGGVQRQELLQKMDVLKEKWHNTCQTSLGCLFDELKQDIGVHMGDLMTKKWLLGCGCLETICATIVDYHSDHRRLKPHNLASLMMNVQFNILGEYIRALETRRISFASYEERKTAGERLDQEGQKLQDMFSRIVVKQEEGVSTFELLSDVLLAIAEFLNLRDKSLLALEVSGFVRKCPDITIEQLSGLIQLREDVGRTEARKLAEEILTQNKHKPKQETAYTKLFVSTKIGDEHTFGKETAHLAHLAIGQIGKVL